MPMYGSLRQIVQERRGFIVLVVDIAAREVGSARRTDVKPFRVQMGRALIYLIEILLALA